MRHLFALGTLAALASSACNALGGPGVTLHNETQWPLTQAALTLRGETLWTGDLAAGESIQRSFTAGEGAFTVTGNLNGQALAPVEVGFASGGDDQRHVLRVMTDGGVAFAAGSTVRHR